MKICPKCNKNLDDTIFSKRKSGKPRPYCAECKRVYDRDYYAKTRAKRLEMKRLAQRARRKMQVAIVREAKNKPCTDCGKIYPFYVMQFDHLDSTQKKFNISNATCNATYSLEKVLKEINKTEVVCANCHATRTYKRRTGTLGVTQ